MKIGLYHPDKLWLSLSNYVNNIKDYIRNYGVEFVPFSSFSHVPCNVDLVWDPRAGGLFPPPQAIYNIKKPVIITEHGCAPYFLPAREFYPNVRRRIVGEIKKRKSLSAWQKIANRGTEIIAVSKFGKWEAVNYLNINEEKITPIYHGVDTKVFTPSGKKDKKYFLHISQYQPKKNFNRILHAFQFIGKTTSNIELLAIVPGYPDNTHLSERIQIIYNMLNQSDLVHYYQNAIGFIFPSIHESFGMPILEAMACGCPVITSNSTACEEIGKGSALLVNPRSIDEIRKAMEVLLENKTLREELSESGLEKVKNYAWKQSAENHLRLFKQVIKFHKQ